MSFNPFARMQIKSFGENIRESSQMGKIEHFFFLDCSSQNWSTVSILLLFPFFSVYVGWWGPIDSFFFFSFLFGIKAKGLIEIRKEYNTSKGIRENYHYISFWTITSVVERKTLYIYLTLRLTQVQVRRSSICSTVE